MIPRLLALQGIGSPVQARMVAVQGIAPGNAVVQPSPTLSGGGGFVGGHYRRGASTVYNHSLKKLTLIQDIAATDDLDEEAIVVRVHLEIAAHEL